MSRPTSVSKPAEFEASSESTILTDLLVQDQGLEQRIVRFEHIAVAHMLVVSVLESRSVGSIESKNLASLVSPVDHCLPVLSR